MRNYLQGGQALDLIAPSGGVTSGVGVLIGALFAVAAVTAAEAATFAGYTEGVFELAAATHASTQAISAGGAVYWDDSAKRCTATATGNTAIGVAVEDKVSTVALVKVKLTPRMAGAGAAIADASVAHALNSTFSDTEAEAALNALGVKVNLIIAALEAAGIIKA